MGGLDRYKLTTIDFESDWTFSDTATRRDYDNKMRAFRKYNDRDENQDFSSGVRLEGFKDKMLAEMQRGSRPCCLNLFWFLVWSLCLMGPLYRVWFGSIVGQKKNHKFVK